MKLSELKSKCFSTLNTPDSAIIYIFDNESSADQWMAYHYHGDKEATAYTLVGIIQSNFVMDYTFNKVWSEAEVDHFHAVDKDTLVVVVDIEEDKA